MVCKSVSVVDRDLWCVNQCVSCWPWPNPHALVAGELRGVPDSSGGDTLGHGSSGQVCAPQAAAVPAPGRRAHLQASADGQELGRAPRRWPPADAAETRTHHGRPLQPRVSGSVDAVSVYVDWHPPCWTSLTHPPPHPPCPPTCHGWLHQPGVPESVDMQMSINCSRTNTCWHHRPQPKTDDPFSPECLAL